MSGYPTYQDFALFRDAVLCVNRLHQRLSVRAVRHAHNLSFAGNSNHRIRSMCVREQTPIFRGPRMGLYGGGSM